MFSSKKNQQLLLRKRPYRSSRATQLNKWKKIGSGTTRDSVAPHCFDSHPDKTLFSRHHIVPYHVLEKLYGILQKNKDTLNSVLWNRCKRNVLNKLCCNGADSDAKQFSYMYVNLFTGPVSTNRLDDPGDDYERRLPASMPKPLRVYIETFKENIQSVLAAKKTNKQELQIRIKHLLETSFSENEITKLLTFLSIEKMTDTYPFILSDWEIGSKTDGTPAFQLKEEQNSEQQLELLNQYNAFRFFPMYAHLSTLFKPALPSFTTVNAPPEPAAATFSSSILLPPRPPITQPPSSLSSSSTSTTEQTKPVLSNWNR